MVQSRKARKLLVASLGVATLSYAAVSCSSSTGPGDVIEAGADATNDVPVANLVSPPADAMEDMPVANLVAPPVDASGE